MVDELEDEPYDGSAVELEEDVYNGEAGHALKHNAVNKQANWLTQQWADRANDPLLSASSADAIADEVDSGLTPQEAVDTRVAEGAWGRDVSAFYQCGIFAVTNSYGVLPTSPASDRWINRMAARLGITDINNQGQSNRSSMELLNRAFAYWTHGNQGLIPLQTGLNDILHTTTSNAAQDFVGAENADRTLLRYLRHGEFHDVDDIYPDGHPEVTEAMVYQGGWDSTVGGTSWAPHGKYRHSNGSTASVTRKFWPYEEITVYLVGWTGAEVSATVTVGGTTYATLNTSSLAGNGPVTDGNGLQMVGFRVTGLPAGVKDVVVTRVTGAGGGLYFGGFGGPPARPPAIAHLTTNVLPRYKETGGGSPPFDQATGDLLVRKRNAILRRVCAEPEFAGVGMPEVIVIDAARAFNPSQIGPDGLHLDAVRGNIPLAELAATEVQAAFGYRPGMNYIVA